MPENSSDAATTRTSLPPSSADGLEGSQRNPFVFACPVCQGALVREARGGLACAADGLTFRYEAGIWRFLPQERAAALAQFRQEYETVRRSEARGSEDSAFYQALPFIGEKGAESSFLLRFLRPVRLDIAWAVRAHSFGMLLEQVVVPLEIEKKRPLRILDLGAGNGWLSNRLAARGHDLAAVDLGVNDRDGLGAQRYYQTKFTCLQAEYDRLPLGDDQLDLLIFNASLHYSVNYEVTLREARRVLRSEGLIVVMDTAVYQKHHSGEQMVAGREATFLRRHGFASNALPSENFLTPQRLEQLADTVGLQWHHLETVPRWRQWVRWLKVQVRRQREPAQFPLILFSRQPPEDADSGKSAVNSVSPFTFIFNSASPSVAQRLGQVGWNAGWLFGARVGQQAILLLFTALVARQLGEVGLGQLAWISAVLYIGNVFSTFGLDTVLLRQIAVLRRTDRVPLASALGLELILAALFIAGLWLAPFSSQTADTLAGLRLYGWVLLPLALQTITNAALRGYEEMGWLSGLTLGTAVLQVGGTAILFALGGTLYALMGWLLLVQVISAGVTLWLCRRILPDFGFNWRRFGGGQMRQLAGIGVWLTLLMVTAVLLQRLGILLLGWLGTTAQMGQLAAALRLAETARLLPAAVMGALFPVLAKQGKALGKWRLGAKDSPSLASHYQLWLLAYGFAAAAALLVLSRPLVQLLFGAGYETAVALLRLLAWGIIPFTLSLPLSLEMVVCGLEKRVLLATFGALLGTAVLTTATFLWHGLAGLAFGLVVGEWLLVLALISAKRWPSSGQGSHEVY